MRYATPQAFRAALEDRLKKAQNETVGISRLRKRVVFERLLARLSAQAAGEWVLKGGFALELRLDELSRSTKDIDVDGSLNEEDATDRLNLAEKVHAYTRTYAGGRPSSRVKDLVDIDIIAATTRLDADPVRRALDALFARRATHPVPSQLPAPPQNWAGTWSKLAAQLPIPATLIGGYQTAAGFLDPILTGTITNNKWEPEIAWK